MSYGKIFPLGGSGGSTSPSGIAGAIQFSNGSAFASDASNLFWDDTNNRLGVGTNAPTVSIQSLGTIQGANLTATANANFGNVLYGPNFWSQANGDTYLGAQTPPSAKLQIKGSGSTSATTSLLVQNSSGTAALEVLDDSRVKLGSSADFTVYSGAGITSRFSMNVGSTSLSTSSAILQVTSTTQGFLPPRQTVAQRTAIVSPAIGLMVYQTDGTEGLYIYKSTGWTFIA